MRFTAADLTLHSWSEHSRPLLASLVLHAALFAGVWHHVSREPHSSPAPPVAAVLGHWVDLSEEAGPVAQEPPAAQAPRAAERESKPVTPRTTSVHRQAAAAVRVPQEKVALGQVTEPSRGVLHQETGRDRDWLGIADQLPTPSAEGVTSQVPTVDTLVERLLVKERERAARNAAAKPPVAAPALAEGATGATSRAAAQASPGTAPTTDTQRGDLYLALARALPAAVDGARWGQSHTPFTATLLLRASVDGGTLTELSAEGELGEALESLRANLFELLRRGAFTTSPAPQHYEVRTRISRVRSLELPALGYTPPDKDLPATAFAVFPSGLRLDATVRLLD